MSHRIYLSSPDVGSAEERAVVDAMRSGWIAPLGPDVDAFEEALAARTGRAHAVALSSGTAALHLGLLVLGVRPGMVVLTSTMTFAATANAIVYAGAEPFFVDSLPDSGNMDPELLEKALAGLRERGESIGAIVPVDLLGKAADYTRDREDRVRATASRCSPMPPSRSGPPTPVAPRDRSAPPPPCRSTGTRS